MENNYLKTKQRTKEINGKRVVINVRQLNEPNIELMVIGIIAATKNR